MIREELIELCRREIEPLLECEECHIRGWDQLFNGFCRTCHKKKEMVHVGHKKPHAHCPICADLVDTTDMLLHCAECNSLLTTV